MSYILEALKRSQQERELGQVPTLETPSFLSEEEGARPSFWILLAVLLASLAVVIALYSALRGGLPDDESIATEARTAPIAKPSTADQEEPVGSTESASERSQTQAFPQQAPVAPGRSLSESVPRAPVGSETTTSSAFVDGLEIAPAAAEQPPMRKRRDVSVPEEQPPAPASEQDSKVPPDLIADIEAFKRAIREEQSALSGAERSKGVTELRDLRLPKAVRARLPDFVMSAHIYDSDPSKRFVLINGLKTREGEESREGIVVEQILPDGAVLSFDGHRFFQRR